MAETLNLSAVANGLRGATSAEQVLELSDRLAADMAETYVTRAVLSAQIARSIGLRRLRDTSPRDFVKLATQASGIIYEAETGIGSEERWFVTYLGEVGLGITDTILDSETPLLSEEQLSKTRRAITEKEFAVRPKSMQSATSRVLARRNS